MAKKRRSSQFKDSSQVIDIEEARRKRQEKREKQKRRSEQTAGEKAKPVRASIRAARRKRVAVYAVIILAIIAAVGVSIYNIVTYQQERDAVKAEQEQLLEEKKELEEQLKRSDEDDYIEDKAREELRLVNPGEIIYVVPEGYDEKDESESTGESE